MCIFFFLAQQVDFLLQDIDCMPLNMLDNIPEALARSIQTSRKLNENSSLSLTGQLKDAKMIQFKELPLAGKTDKTDIPSDSLPSAIHIMKKLNPPEVSCCFWFFTGNIYDI